MARTSAAAKVGAVVVAATVLLAAVAWFFLGRGIGGYPVDVSFKDAQGAKEGADVRLAGVKIGAVREIDVDASGRRAVLHLTIFPNRRVPEKAVYTVTSGGLLGEMFVQISPVPGSADGRYLDQDGKPVPSIVGTDLPTFDELKVKAAQLGTGANDVMTSMANISRRLEKLSNDAFLESSLKRTAANMATASDKAVLAASRVEKALEQELPTLRAMLKDVKTATDRMPAAGDNVAQITGNVNRLVKRMDETVVFLRTAIQDTLEGSDIKPSLKTTMANLAKASTEFQGIAADARKISADLASKGEATSRIGDLVTSVQQVAEKANNLLDKISGVAAKAGSARGPRVSIVPQFEAYQSMGEGARFRADIGLAIPRGKDASILLGLRDVGEGNKVNLQDVTSPSPNYQVRYGLHASRLGVGLDYALKFPPLIPGMPLQRGAKRVSIDFYSPNDPQLDIIGHTQIDENMGISLGFQDMLHRSRPTIGLTYRK